MTLEEAADDLVAKLGALDQDIREASGALEDVGERVASLREQLGTDWAALEAQGRTLLDALEHEEETVERESDETEEALRGLESAFKTGQEELVGEVGVVRKALDPDGLVFVHGEIWQARSDGDPIPADTVVRVERIGDGLVLAVSPVDEPAAVTA